MSTHGSEHPRTIVMTGVTDGFGAVAAARLAVRPRVRLLRGTRRPGSGAEDRATATARLDLASLDSVRVLAAQALEFLGGARLDALVLNAGIIGPDAQGRSADGFETTFAVNHLAHFLLLRLLQPSLAPGGVVVLTSSGTHDPALGAELVPPRHAEAALLAHPEFDPGLERRPHRAGQQAYTASKLCAVLTVRALALGAGSPAPSEGLRALAFDPGQVFGTGLAGALPLPRRIAWALMGTGVLGELLRRIEPSTMNSQEDAGRVLAGLALGARPPGRPPDGGGNRSYVVLRRGRAAWAAPSVLARDDEAALRLWRDSDRLVGTSPTAL